MCFPLSISIEKSATQDLEASAISRPCPLRAQAGRFEQLEADLPLSDYPPLSARSSCHIRYPSPLLSLSSLSLSSLLFFNPCSFANSDCSFKFYSYSTWRSKRDLVGTDIDDDGDEGEGEEKSSSSFF